MRTAPARRLRTSGDKLRHLTTFDKLCAAAAALMVVPFLVTLLVLLNQRREENSAAVTDAEESFAIREAAKERQHLHEKLDAALSRKG